MPYDPPLQTQPCEPTDPLEIELAYSVGPCGTHNFSGRDSAQQPHGPYSNYDFTSQVPSENSPKGTSSFVWIEGITRTPSFPSAEIMDGCRKAPIMTTGVKPNPTAFARGLTSGMQLLAYLTLTSVRIASGFLQTQVHGEYL